jgi:translation initiation factor 1A
MYQDTNYTEPKMPKNTKGGSKAKKTKNFVEQERELEFKDSDQEYAKIVKAFGSNRYEAQCMDGKTRLAHARGNLKKKKVFVKVGDIVIVSLRDFCEDKCDIIYIYKPKEVIQLRKLEEISTEMADDTFGEEKPVGDLGIEFASDDVAVEEEAGGVFKEINFDDI